MFQFTRKDKKSGITYVYEQESRWIPELKQSRAIRRIIGKLDDEGNIVPTRSRRKKKTRSNQMTQYRGMDRSQRTEWKSSRKELLL